MRKRPKNEFSRKVESAVLAKTNGRCYYCGDRLPPDTEYKDEQGLTYLRSRNWDVDHLIPYSKGGSNRVDNLVPACKTCNRQKSARSADEFIELRSL